MLTFWVRLLPAFRSYMVLCPCFIFLDGPPKPVLFEQLFVAQGIIEGNSNAAKESFVFVKVRCASSVVATRQPFSEADPFGFLQTPLVFSISSSRM